MMRTKYVAQRTNFDCGVAALAMAIGVDYEAIESALGTKCKTIGVTANESVLLLMRWGFRPIYLITTEAIKDMDPHAELRLGVTHDYIAKCMCASYPPAILTVRCPGGGLHAVYFDGLSIFCPRRGELDPVEYFRTYTIMEVVLCR